MPLELDALLARFGFDGFRPGQREVIEALDQKSRALAVFPTGGGKSICYQLPALGWEGLTVVISPLIALMKDQIDFLRSRQVAAGRLDSSLSDTELRATTDAIHAGRMKLLYVAPERFQNERFLQLLERTRISLFAVDEAHCISEWGHNFRPDYLKLAETARAVSAERILALTATATPAVVADVCGAFEIPGDCSIVTGFYRPNLAIALVGVSARDRESTLVHELRTRPPGPAIVYVTLQKTAERVASVLRAAGLPAEAYHAGMDSEVRSAVQERWKASDRGIVVATIAFGMGIDKSDVRYVYHFNLPKSLESYSQEIGRAGRDGLPSTVEVLATVSDVPMLQNFAYGDTPTGSSVRGLVRQLLGQKDATFDVSFTELADRHDMRPLVVRTAVTYLELLGLLRMNGPFYAGYRLRPLAPEAEIIASFRGEPAIFVRDVFRHAKKARTWYTVDPARLGEAMGQPRSRVIRALEVLDERGHVELAASDLRHRYTRLAAADVDVDGLAATLAARFARREEQETRRLAMVLDWIGTDGCHTNALVAYFGEQRSTPCGHCTGCLTGPVELPAGRPAFMAPAESVRAELHTLRAEHPAALAEPRQAARLLCGLTSPSLTRAKLSRHPLFGRLAEESFPEVLAWCEGQCPPLAPRVPHQR